MCRFIKPFLKLLVVSLLKKELVFNRFVLYYKIYLITYFITAIEKI